MLSALNDVLHNSACAIKKIMRSTTAAPVEETAVLDEAGATEKQPQEMVQIRETIPVQEKASETPLQTHKPHPTPAPTFAPMIQPQEVPEAQIDELSLDRWA